MRIRSLSMVLVIALVASSGAAWGQCILANPSFEVGGSGGSVIGGWNHFGSVGTSPTAVHGLVSARVSGPNEGSWGASGYWQPLDTAVGESWEAKVRVRVDGANPFGIASKAMLNIEWRDASGLLISYETHTAADIATPVDRWVDVSVVSGLAPDRTTSVRILLGVLQGPGEAAPTVLFDSVTFFRLDSPTMDEQQWADFPGGRVIDFAGYSWRVKGDGFYEPGPDFFSDDPNNVWVDDAGELHLTVKRQGVAWYSTEVVLEDPLGYGDYIFTTRGRLDAFDPHTVLGLFLWQYGPCWAPQYLWWNPFNEIDIEFSRWGDPATPIGGYTAQPWDWPGNTIKFDAAFSEDEITSHAFRWTHDHLEFRSWRGGPMEESTSEVLFTWAYEGPHNARPEQPRVHMNLWAVFDNPDTEQEAVLADFTFVPESTSTAVEEDPSASLPPGAPGRLRAARPNPFNPSTEIRYELDRGAEAQIAVYSLSGRRVRTLVSGFVPAGQHRILWDGRDEDGALQSSGVYLYRLSTNDFVETRKLTLLK
jgi:hypothetical protein